MIAVLFKMGRENTFIKEFLKAIPGEEGKDTLPSGTVRFEDLFLTIPKKEEAGFYFSTMDLSQRRLIQNLFFWIVKKYILEALPEQITGIEKEGDNARHVRALYARKVYSNK